MSDVWWCPVTSRINDVPARGEIRLNRSSSAPRVKIRRSQSFR